LKNPWQTDVEEFMRSGEHPAPSKPDFSTWPGELRLALIEEEAAEIRAAWMCLKVTTAPSVREKYEAEIIDGLIDLIYVTVGAASAAGIDLQPFWEEVHSANLRKFSLGVLKNDAGKVIKPPSWKGPEMLEVLRAVKDGAA
jgi:predicted HAD superfamily Cof-like phosphohydrolase